MNDDIERRLRQATPRGAPVELRSQVLAAVAIQLQPSSAPSSHRSLRAPFVIAASVLASLALNYGVNNTLDRRLATVLGPPPIYRQAAEIATDVASVTDSSTGQWAYERLAVSQSAVVDPRDYAMRLQQMIHQVTIDFKETNNETLQKNPQMDHDLRGSRYHPLDGVQRVLRLEYRNTA